MYRSRFKKIHLTDVQCLKMNNSEDGSKSLRMPVEFTKASLLGNQLLPRKNLRRTFSEQNIDLFSYQRTGTEDGLLYDQPVSSSSSVSQPLQKVLYSEVSTVSGGEMSRSFRTASQFFSDNIMDLLPQNMTRVGTTDGFISARQYMNPTHHLCSSDDGARKTSGNESALEKSGTSLSPARKRSKKTVPQRNNLDRYFTKLPLPDHSSSSTDSQIPGSQGIEDDVAVPENSPRRSIMRSPISKVPGTNSLYYSSPNSSCVRNSAPDLKTSEILSAKKLLWSEDSDFELAIPNCTMSINGSTCSKGKRPRLGDKSLSSCDHSSSRGKLSQCDRKEVTKQEPVDFAECKFGLFGFSDSELIELAVDTDFEDENVARGINHFSRLPLDIVENILCRLPFMDLHLSVNRVCTSWNDIVSSPSFVPWKKKYFHLLKADKDVYLDMEEQMGVNKMVSLELYLPSLIRFMKTFKPATGRGGMDDLLRRHPKYGLARDLLLERFQDCFLGDQVPNPWCTIATFVILSESVGDIQGIIRCLLGRQSLCMASELIDGLYCIASFLWMFKSLRLDDVWNGMHYRLYYTLYLYENESVSTVGQLNEVRNQCGQQSLYRYSASDTILRLTHEQMRICDHHIETGQTVKIIAFAGTGKTTTLVQYTKMRPSTKFLLVVYNRSVCDHAKTRFPPNVDCFNVHKLAYRAVAWKYKNAKKLGSNVRVSDILDLLRTRKGENLYTQAKFVVETLNGFMASSDPFITTAHVPTQMINDDELVHSIDHSVQMHLADDAQNIWNQMVNLKNKSILLPHDGYLKLWQLQKPRIQKYDVILIDEAQDLTPAVIDIFLNQLQPKILVGDPHQQIYSFRGAVNAMNLITPTHTFYLTQSFRFGPEISFVAASCLELFKKENRKILVGNGIPGGIYGDRVGQMAIIARSNCQLFSEIVKKCSYSEENIKVSFAGGIEGYGFDMIEDIYYLMIGKTNLIHTPLIKHFMNRGYAELSNYAKKSYDKELSSKLTIVNRFMGTVPSHIAQIRKKYVADPDMADIIFTTAHKSKGLEFDTVYLADDFIDAQANADVQSIVEDEYNLLYVAVTRAKSRLIMSMPLLKALDRVGERFFYPVSTKELQKEDCGSRESSGQDSTITTKAVKTSVADKPVVTIVKRRLYLSDGVEIGSRVITPESVSENIHSMKGIAGPVL